MALSKLSDTKVIASIAASAMLIRTIANDLVPRQVQDFFSATLSNVFQHFSAEFTIIIEEFHGLSANELFEATDLYLGTKLTPSAHRIKLGKSENEKTATIAVDRNEHIIDSFEGVHVKWRLVYTRVKSKNHHMQHLRDMNATLRSEIRSYELSFHKKHKEQVLSTYLAHVMEASKSIKAEAMGIKFHTVDYHGRWNSDSISLEHPMTFKNLALDSELKKEILDNE